MIITLNTHRDEQVLKITNVAPDSFTLFIRSDGFSGSVALYNYDTSWLPHFIDELRRLESLAVNKITLVDVEDNELRFDMDALGHVQVSGRLVQHGLHRQELNFSFSTDQTCLKPFIADLEKALQQGKAASA